MSFDLWLADRAATLDPEDTAARFRLQAARSRLGLTGVTLRPYQINAVQSAIDFVENSEAGQNRRVFVAPCGSGKGTIQLETVAALRGRGLDTWIITPGLEIIKGFLERLGHSIEGSNEKIAKAAFDLGITTATRFVNRLVKSEIALPDVLVIDEVHQWIDSNANPETIFAMAPDVPAIGFTATPFRATNKGTIAFREQWGEPEELISIADAVRDNFVLMPEFHIRPLVDDSLVRIVNGELDAREVSAAYEDQFPALVDLIEEVQPLGPTAVSVASTPMAEELARRLEARGLVPAVVLQDTKGADRTRMYAAVQRNEEVLIQLRVLSVGADLPALENLIDCQPTQSSVLFLQTYGRVARKNRNDPNKVARIYCTNRNVERFGWLYGELCPVEAVKSTQEGFEGPSARGGGRLFGFEMLGRMRTFNVPMESDGYITFYNLVGKDESIKSPIFREYVIAMHPSGRCRCATRETGKGLSWKDPRTDWKEMPIPEELSGFSSSKSRYNLSDGQKRAWTKLAPRVGLPANYINENPDVESRVFQILFTAMDCGWRF